MLHFKIYIPSPLWIGEGKRRIKVFNQPFEHCIFEQAFWDTDKNKRPRGIYSLDGEVELTHKASLSFAPSQLPFHTFILKAHTFFFLLVGKGQLKVISRSLKLWPLPTQQLQLFSCPVCTLNSRPLNYFQFLNTFQLSLVSRSSSL